MAVFTPVSEAEAAAFLDAYDLGALRSLTPIAEGVENTNYRLETARGRRVLTLFERRTEAAALPFCLGLTDHLAARGYPAARPERDRTGGWIGRLNDRPAAVVQWVEGAWLRQPRRADHAAGGRALAELHGLAADFDRRRANPVGPQAWEALWERCDEATSGRADADPERAMVLSLRARMDRLPSIEDGLPGGPIHADYFPDNVLFQDGAISGVIDFYFACDGAWAYDLAIALNAWAFDAEGRRDALAFDAFLDGYESVRRLTPDERAALPGLGAAAAVRFTLTRLHDWLRHDPSWLVTPKDPRPFFSRLTEWDQLAVPVTA